MATVRNTLVLAVAGILAAVGLIAPATAAADGTPDVNLEKTAPARALLGTNQKVTLTAGNPGAGAATGYNLTFRDILPEGVNYVPGSAAPAIEPLILHDAPAAGETTLIFENVADLSARSHYALSYEVEPTAAVYTIRQTYTDEASAFVNEDPRFEPKFSAEGLPEPASYTGSAEDTAETTLTAVEIEKVEPSPEHELLRGVHEHQTVYTLKLRNNEVGPTNDLSVDDYLPAGLEFLGCGSVDHTTKAKTNEGGVEPAEEYPGSGPIFPGNDPAAPHCVEPTLVETEKVDPPGPQPLGVYTHVRWEGLGKLEPGEQTEIQYRAAVPILKNTLTWTDGKPTEPLAQAANLDNNTGTETEDEEALTNVAQVSGKYEGTTEVEDTDELTVTAEDLAIQKYVSPTTINSGEISHWKFEVETSEYRYTKNIRIEDRLPDGLCPLGKENYENTTQQQAECESSAGLEPTAEYASVEEQADGGFLIEWNEEKAAELAEMGPSETLTIEFPTRTRVFYQKDFEDDKERPILTHDSWVNHVEMAGADYARCAPADPRCENKQPEIAHTEPNGIDDLDESEAGQVAAGVGIDKKVRLPGGGIPVDCETGTYVDGPAPSYRPGDEVCWQVRVDFAADLFAGKPVVTDFLPPDEEYVAGSATPVAGVNTVSVEAFNEVGNVLEWTLGEAVPLGSKVFAYRFKSKVGRSAATVPFDVEGNLMKFASANSAGETFPERDQVDIEREEPDLKIVKGVYEVGGTAVGGEGSPDNDKDATGAHGGEIVKYGVQLENTGTLEAEAIEVWDRLPAGIECADLVAGSISDGGTCEAGNVIVWTGLSVAAKATLPALTYEVSLPSDIAPNQTYENTAGVRRFESATNTGTPFEYFPEDNIDPKFGAEHAANTGSIKDPATVSTEAAMLEKTRVTAIEQEPGNDLPDQATIGEAVRYTLTATVPPGSVLFGSPTITDPLGERLALVAGTVKGEVDGTSIPDPGLAGFTVGEEAGNPVLHFPASYENLAGSGPDTIVLEFEAKVTDVAADNRLTGGTLTNIGKLSYQDQSGAAQEVTKSADTTIVEPKVTISKAHAGGKTVKPGDIVDYTVTAGNSGEARVSTANESVVTDSVPDGMTPVNGETPVTDGGAVSPDGGTWDEGARTITWTIATLAPGTTKPLHYSLRVNKPADAGSVFKNSATITTTSLPGAEPGERTAGSSSNTGYEAEAEDEATLTDALLEKSVEAPQGTTIGDPLTYTLHLTLPPNIRFFNTTVEDQLPKGVVYDPPDGAAGPDITCTPSCTAVASAGLELTPKAVGGATLLGWYFGQIEAATEERTVTIVYHAHIGQELEPGVLVEDEDQLENTAIGLYNNTEKPGGPPSEPPPPGEFTNRTNEPSQSVEVVEPHLEIAKAVSGEVAPPEETQPGDKYTYTLTVTNSGHSPAYDVVVKDDNPQGVLRHVDPTGAGNEGSGFLVAGWAPGDPLEWVIPGPIAANGGVVHLQYTAELAESAELHEGDRIENVADIPVYFGVPEAERNEPGRFREYTEDPEDTVTLKTSLPRPKVEKTVGTGGADEATVEIGEPFTWQVKVTNQATAAIWKGVDLLDTLPRGWEYVTGSAEMPLGSALRDPTRSVNGAGEEELGWSNLADLGPGASFTVTFKAVPTLALAREAGPYTNKAKASGEDASGATESAAEAYEAEDTAKANLITPHLEITKTPDVPGPGSEAVAGRSSAYSIEIHNSGNAEATAVEVTDLLGPGNDYTAGSATAAPTAGFAETAVEPIGAGETQVKWTIASIVAGATVTIHVPVSLDASIPDGTKLVDHANVKSPQESAREDEGSLLVKRQSDLELTKEQMHDKLLAGENESYTLKVKNLGPSDATGVVVEDELPASVMLITPPIGCEEAAPGIKCNVGDMALNEELAFTFRVKVLPSATGAVVNEAKVTSTTEDTDPNNNHDDVSATLESAADLAIHKSGPTAPVLRGSTFTYKLEVENNGPSDATGVEVEDPLPPELEGLTVDTDTGTCVEPPGTTVECSLGTLVPGQRAVLHVTVKAVGMPSGPAGVVNVAKVMSTTNDPEPANDESEAETIVEPAADLAVTKTAPATVPAGGELTYGLHVEDRGPSDGTDVQVTDPLPAGTQFVAASAGCSQAGGTVTCAVGELKAGEARDDQVTVRVPVGLADHDLVNTATVKGHEADPESKNDSSTVTTRTGPAADLSITKTMGKAVAGQPLTYTLAITNHGPSAASAVTVKDTLPAGTTFKSAAPSQGSCAAAGQAVTCRLGALPAGASAQVSITVDVAATATGELRNVATVEGPEPDPNRSNNESAVEGPIDPPAPSASNLRVVKTANTSRPTVGKPFDYHVTVTNVSGTDAKKVKVLDTLSGPVKVLSIESEAGHCDAAGSKITCTIPRVPVHKTVRITYSVVAERTGGLRNTASAQAANGEKAPKNNHAMKSVKARAAAPARFKLSKTASRKVVAGGKKVGFAIKLRNGAGALVDAKVCDRLPATLVFVKAPGARYVHGEACWTKKFVGAHKVLHFHLVARAVKGYKSLRARNVATAGAENAVGRRAAATVRIKPAFAGAPGGVTG